VQQLRVAALVPAVFLAILVAGCAPAIKEVRRVSSPDGLLEAVIAVRQTDATVPTPTEVYLLQSKSAPSGEPVWRADNVSGLELAWVEGRSLQIRASEARVFLKRDGIDVAMSGGQGKLQVTIVYKVERSL
jgi:hypothetical protein